MFNSSDNNGDNNDHRDKQVITATTVTTVVLINGQNSEIRSRCEVATMSNSDNVRKR